MKHEEKAIAHFNVSRTLNTLAVVAAAAYALQLHGWLVAFATLLFLWIARGFTANRITWWYIGRIAERDEEPDMAKLLKMTMAARWAWVIVAFLALAASGAEVCTEGACRSLWSSLRT